MDTAVFFLLLLETFAILAILAVLAIFVASFFGFMKKIEEMLGRALDNIAFLTNTARQENLPKKASELISEVKAVSEELRTFISRLASIFSLPQAVTSATHDLISETARAAKEKALSLGAILSALAYGISKGWQELRRPRISNDTESQKEKEN